MRDPRSASSAAPVRRLRRALSRAALTGVLAVSAAGCTGDSGDSTPGSGPSSPPPSTGEATTLQPDAAPPKVRVTRVAGRMRPKAREVLAANVQKVVTGYFDDAFVDGPYPRSDFSDAFATFSAGARREAKQESGLLTNEALGSTTEAVVPLEQTAYLAVLAPNKVAAGVTAKVELRYLVMRPDKPDRIGTLKGRLLLTRKKSGGWQIFGYDLSRSVRPGEEGS